MYSFIALGNISGKKATGIFIALGNISGKKTMGDRPAIFFLIYEVIHSLKLRLQQQLLHPHTKARTRTENNKLQSTSNPQAPTD